MAGTIETRLKEIGITLPDAPIPAANYVPAVISGVHAFIAGQVPFQNGELTYIGKVGQDYTVEEAQACARVVGLNILAQLSAALDGDLDRVVNCVKLGGFVNSGPDFHDHPKVINGASDLMFEVFGDAGKHARFAVGAPSLPFNVAVEIDAIFEVRS
jgi:enamine deaminase RidA (YjgF/YER057c/UK114 family)